jgi:septum formation protein
MRLVLASASPRRAELLRGLGVPFSIRPADIDESPQPGEPAESYVARLARAKALNVWSEGEVVLAADTTVVAAERILGKPADREEGRAMLRALAGRPHSVLTGYALAFADPTVQPHCLVGVERTEVTMGEMSEEEIRWYVETGEGVDKAGGYAIQGRASLFVERVEGSYSNVVGLPIAAIYALAREQGLEHLLRRSVLPGN